MSNSIVFKYPMPEPGKSCTIKMPPGSKVLSVQLQGGALVAWVLHEQTPHSNGWDNEDRQFFVSGTGQPTGYTIDQMRHVDTVQVGSLVWHVFEIIKI